MAALNPGQFKGPLYHGTTFDLQGPDIKPASKSGHSNWGSLGHSGQRSNQHAFATESEDTAWQFGSQAGMMKRKRASSASRPGPDRVQVHEVAPHPLMQRGVYHSDHPDFQHGENLKEWKSPSFRSKGTIDIMPGRQGTFPSLNWNQFRSEESGYVEDMNHPDDFEAAKGHNALTGREHTLRTFRAHDIDSREHRGDPTPVTDEHQMDLFSGKTVGEHAEMDDSPVGDYHRNNLFGRV